MPPCFPHLKKVPLDKNPKRLKAGDKVAIVCLSSGMLGEDDSKHCIEIGKRRLEAYGLEVVFMPNALKGIKYLNEHPEKRADDLKQAFYDDSIKGIICAIGGDDTYRLLPYLMEDRKFLEAVEKSPKIFTGYSDTTINHLMFYKLGMTSYYGPNFICDIAEAADEMLPYTKKTFESYLGLNDYKEIVSSPIWYSERTDFSAKSVGTNRKENKETRGFEVLQGSGKICGKLLGGCIESLYDVLTDFRYSGEMAICEKYGIFPSTLEWADKILFLETSEEKPTPELLEKELLSLKQAGVFDVISGIIVGKPQDEVYYEDYKEVYKKVINNEKLPILYNINFGHSQPKCILPYGIETEVDMDNKTIIFKEKLWAE